MIPIVRRDYIVGGFITALLHYEDGTPYFTVDREAMSAGARKQYDKFIRHHRKNPEGWRLYEEIVIYLQDKRGDAKVGSDEIHSKFRERSHELSEAPGDACFKVNNNHRSSYARLFMLVYEDRAGRVGIRKSYLDKDKGFGHVHAGQATPKVRERLDEEEEEAGKNLNGVPDVDVVRQDAWKVIEALRVGDVKAARGPALQVFKGLGG